MTQSGSGSGGTITTHVLDTSLGAPAQGVRVSLERVMQHGEGDVIGSGVTDADGRANALLGAGRSLAEGVYRLRFDTDAYFARDGRATFFPDVSITFRVGREAQHYHVPLLLSPFGYSTYRGS
jgi:5-hydroxyisourate hydrolase